MLYLLSGMVVVFGLNFAVGVLVSILWSMGRQMYVDRVADH